MNVQQGHIEISWKHQKDPLLKISLNNTPNKGGVSRFNYMVPTYLEKCLNLTSVLKIAWIFNLPWKLTIFLEKCLKITVMGLKNNGSRNLICLCVCFFMQFCTVDFDKLNGDSVILSSNLPSLLVRWSLPIPWSVFHMVNIVIWCMASYSWQNKHLQSTR